MKFTYVIWESLCFLCASIYDCVYNAKEGFQNLLNSFTADRASIYGNFSLHTSQLFKRFFRNSNCARNDLPPNARIRLERILHENGTFITDKEKFKKEWKEKYKRLEERLESLSAHDQSMAAAKDRMSSGDFEDAVKLMEQSLEEYLTPNWKRSYPLNFSLLKKINHKIFSTIDLIKFFSFLGIRKKSSPSIRNYLKHIRRIPKKVIAESFYNLGLIKELNCEYQGALSIFEKALQFDRENENYLNQLGEIYYALGKFEKAAVYYDKALAIELKTYWDEQPDEAIDCHNTESACDSSGNLEKAIEYYEKGLKSISMAYSDGHPSISIRLNNFGMAWESLGNYVKAIEYYEKALCSNLKIYGDNYPIVAINRQKIGDLWRALDRHEKAIEQYEKTLKVFKKAFGNDHPDTKLVANNLRTAKTKIARADKVDKDRSRKIAIIVLGCASPPYDVMIDTIRDTWGSVKEPGVDIYYLYGNPDDDYTVNVLSRYNARSAIPVKNDHISAIGDVLIAGCADNFRQQEDCILRKRLIAFGYLTSVGGYDLIYTVCATSYVDQARLRLHADHLPAKQMISGAVSLSRDGIPFVSGASMLLSADVARKLSVDRQEIIELNCFGFRDDVAIGHWIVTRISKLSLEAFAEDVRKQHPMTPDHIFFPCPHTTVDYVMAPAEKQQPVAHAFHYHFHSRKPGDMIGFHKRYVSGAV